MIYSLLNCTIIANDLDWPSRSFQPFCLKISAAYLSSLWQQVQASDDGWRCRRDLEGHISCCKRFHCLYLENTAHTMYGLRSVERHIWAMSHLLCAAARDLLVVAEFLLHARYWQINIETVTYHVHDKVCIKLGHKILKKKQFNVLTAMSETCNGFRT